MNNAQLVIPSLTGLRQIAAFFVVLHHLVPETSNEYINGLLRELNVGVTMFFVLSGFLISYRYFDNYKSDFIWTKKYVVRRFARIYPMYFLVTSVIFLNEVRTNSQSGYDIFISYILNISFLKGFSDKYVYSGIAQGWTLTVEECFYILAPILFYLFHNKKSLLFLMPLLIFATGFLFERTNLMSHNSILINTIFGRIFEFFVGIMAFLIFKSYSNHIQIIFKSCLTVMSIFLFMILINIQVLFIQDDLHKYAVQSFTGWMINSFLISSSVALLILGLATEKTLLNKILSSNLFQILGKSSYTLYLVHWGIFSYLLGIMTGNNTILLIIAVQILAILLWRFIEEPLNTKISNYFIK